MVPAFATAQAPGTLPSLTTPAGAVPHDARPQLGELVRWITAREHVEHVLQLGAGRSAERIGTAHQLSGGRRRRSPRPHRSPRPAARARRSGLRGILGLLDQRLPASPSRPLRTRARSAAELREDAAFRNGAEVVAGSADRCKPRQTDFGLSTWIDEVDRPHVDPELERRGGDEAWNRPAFSSSSISTRCSRQRAVVSPRDGLVGELVEPYREPLGAAAGC